MQSKRTPATQVEKQAEEHSAKDMRAAVKKLARSYRDMKNYIAYIQNKRPTLLKQAKVDLREYKSRGLVTYADYVSLFPKSDRDIIEAYVKCLRGVYCLEQGIFLIKDERTRAIASDSSAIPKAALCLVPSLLEIDGFILVLKTAPATVIRSPWIITPPS